VFKQAVASYAPDANNLFDKVWLAMGNHECTGTTAFNCDSYDQTPNITAFMSMLPPGVNTPYYRKDVATPLGSAKFLFVAANAWSAAQQSWLQAQLSDATKYTFIIRHEPHTSSGAPTGATTSETMIASSSFTLELLGHTHEYKHGVNGSATADPRRVISGNAGAPLQPTSAFQNYGFLMVQQQANGDIAVSEIDEASGSVIDSFTVQP
jgi:hypothetical protein